MTIRPIEQDDLARIEYLELVSFSNPWSMESLRFLLNQSVVSLCLLDEEKEIVGYGGMMLSGDDGEILNLAIDPACRGKGLGCELMKAFMDAARVRGLVSMSLEVRESNSPAIRLYSKLGFEKVGKIKNYYVKPKENAYLMARKL